MQAGSTIVSERHYSNPQHARVRLGTREKANSERLGHTSLESIRTLNATHVLIVKKNVPNFNQSVQLSPYTRIEPNTYSILFIYFETLTGLGASAYHQVGLLVRPSLELTRILFMIKNSPFPFLSSEMTNNNVTRPYFNKVNFKVLQKFKQKSLTIKLIAAKLGREVA